MKLIPANPHVAQAIVALYDSIVYYRTPTILMCKLGVQVQPVVDRTYHNRSKLDTHIDEYVTM